MPEVRKRHIDAPFLCWEGLDVALEILGVLVHQGQQVVHQAHKRTVRSEIRDHGDQSRAATCQDFEGANSLALSVASRDSAPESRALRGVQRFEPDGSEEIVERVFGLIDRFKSGCCTAEQDDPWLCLKHLAETPSLFRIRHTRKDHV